MLNLGEDNATGYIQYKEGHPSHFIPKPAYIIPYVRLLTPIQPEPNHSEIVGMFPSVGHHRVMEAAQKGALVTMVLKWCIIWTSS